MEPLLALRKNAAGRWLALGDVRWLLAGCSTALPAEYQSNAVTFAHPINDGNGVMDVATGADGNYYIMGRFTGTMQLGTTLLTSPGLCLYVAKCKSTGEVLHVTQLETTKDVLPTSMAMDQAGNGYMTGNFNGTLSCQGGRQSISQQRGDNASFVLKTQPDGEVQWLRQAEKATASAHDFGTGANVAVDEAGNCYVTGSVDNVVAAAPGPGPPAYQAFLLSYDALGTMRWAREWASMGAGSHSTSKGVAVGRNGQCFVSSEFYRGCKLGSVTLETPANAYSNYFLARSDAITGDLTWTSALPANVAAKSVATDHSGQAYVGGSISVFANPAQHQFAVQLQGPKLSGRATLCFTTNRGRWWPSSRWRRPTALPTQNFPPLPCPTVFMCFAWPARLAQPTARW